jgi:RNA polymerase sporulation-specific sigma factor
MGERTLTIADVKADPSLMNLFVEENLGLVRTVVVKYAPTGYEYDDLFQCGCIGMYKAINNFKLEIGCEFSTYAVPMIHGEIMRFLRDNNAYSSMKVSRKLRSLFYKQLRLVEAKKTDAEICKELQIDKEELAAARTAMQPFQYMEDEIKHAGKGDGTPIRLQDQLSCDYNLEEDVTNKLDLHETIRLLKELVPEKVYEVLTLKMKDITQEEIGVRLGISQVQASRFLCKVEGMIRAIHQYYEGEISYEELKNMYSKVKTKKGGREVKHADRINVIVQWAIEHPGEDIKVPNILREAGYDVLYSYLNSFKTQAINKLKSMGYTVIKEGRSWRIGLPSELPEVKPVDTVNEQQAKAPENTVVEVKDTAKKEVKETSNLKVKAIFIVEGEFSTYTVQDGKISFSQSEVPLDRLGDYLGELRQVSYTIQQKLSA